MTKSIVARLRERIAEMREAQRNGYFHHSFSLKLVINLDDIAALLDIVEAVAEVEPWNDRRYCRYCGRAEWEHEALHSLDCPYRRAREMCGKGDD